MEYTKNKYRLNPRTDVLDEKPHEFGVNVRHSAECIFDKVRYECLFHFTFAIPVRRGDVTSALLVAVSRVAVVVKWNAFYGCLTGRT
jgi:hypothetical protein